MPTWHARRLNADAGYVGIVGGVLLMTLLWAGVLGWLAWHIGSRVVEILALWTL